MKNTESGFTLIELLVVVVIVGILAAIALPTFLNQTSKARQSEAKSTISSVNSAQTVYRTEHNAFTGNWADLALGLPASTNNYSYALTGTTDTATIIATSADTALKGYSGGSIRYQNAANLGEIRSAICEAVTAGTTAPAPPTLDATASDPASCPATEVKL